jgi:hypothetical protein
MNHDPAIDHLIQEVLDGSASPSDQERIRTLVARDPVVRERFEELSTVFEALGSVPESEPPASLHGDIMNAIGTSPRPAPETTGWLAGLRTALARRPVATLAYGFVAGALVGASALVINGGPLPVSGTFAPMSSSADARFVARQVVRLGESNVTLETWREGATVELRVQPGDAPGLEAEVATEDGKPATMGVTWSKPGPHTLDVLPGRAVASQAGDGDFRIAFDATNGNAPLKIKLRRGDLNSLCELPVAAAGR